MVVLDYKKQRASVLRLKKSVLCEGIRSKSGEMPEERSNGLWQVIWERLNKLPILSHLSQCQGLQ